MNIINGLFPFDVLDADKDGLISFEDFFKALHPIEHAHIFDTGNLVARKIYENKVGEDAKKPWFAALWWLITDSLETSVTKEQYEKAVTDVHRVGKFDENNNFVILDPSYPRVNYVKEQYDKVKVNA